MHSSTLLKQLSRTVGIPADVEITDGQLLRSFLATDDQAAFACLFRRHAPVIYRSAIRIVHDQHHAEDVVQAVFLVLCRQASAIRQEQSLAGWLHRVAVRIALKLRSDTTRLPLLPFTEIRERGGPASSTNELDLQASLEEELSKLPAKYQMPLVMHYLQGKPAGIVAGELRLTYGAVLVRLARGRDKLRARCLRNDRTPGADRAFVLAIARIGLPGEMPEALVRSTLEIARLSRLGAGALASLPQSSAIKLAEGVRHALAVTKMKTALALTVAFSSLAICACLVCAGAGTTETEGLRASINYQAPTASVRAESATDQAKYEFSGTVREEGTGKPVQGATLNIMMDSGGRGPQSSLLKTKTDTDGRFSQSLPAGNFRAWNLLPPPGFNIIPGQRINESLVVNQSHSKVTRDYLVRRGTVWSIHPKELRVVNPADQPFVLAMSRSQPVEFFQSSYSSEIFALTLPIKKGSVTVQTGQLAPGIGYPTVDLDWEDGFNPSAVGSITKMPGSACEYRLVDKQNRKAKIKAKEPVAPEVNEFGTLQIRVSPNASKVETGELVGQIVDERGKPLSGATISLGFDYKQSGSMSPYSEHTQTTNAEGRYRLPGIPRWNEPGEPTMLHLVVTHPGFAGVDSHHFRFDRPRTGPQVAETVRLVPGKIVSGIVLQADGKPAGGAWVVPTGSIAAMRQFTKSDITGHFTVRDLPAGVSWLTFEYGDSQAYGSYWAEENPKPVVVTLKPRPAPLTEAERQKVLEKVKQRPDASKLLLKKAAPEWELGNWSDGKTRSIQDFRGKVVFLDFWGIWCGPCVHALPSIEKLRSKYEPRGVVFLSIHTPGDDETAIRKLLASKKTDLVFAIDKPTPQAAVVNLGVTGERYNVSSFPTSFLIDRSGKIAFRSDDPAKEPEFLAIVKALGFDEKTITEQQASQVIEKFLENQIEKVISQK